MTIESAPALLLALRECHLLDAAQEEAAAELPQQFLQPKALARELLQRGWVTPYQINNIFLGRRSDLVLGSYVLLERLGEGGMGTVFKARNWKLGRIVALKLIRADRLSQASGARRFQREVHVAAQLDHPNIVQAYDAGQVGDRHFLVMEYVEGTDLDRLVRKSGPLPTGSAVSYFRQAALALQYAHERGLVHRDIKPANLLLATASEVIKISDLGLARIIEGEGEESSSCLTQEGLVVGTVDYLAPEQARDAHRVDIRADLYSLGCSLYFVLTGRPPFTGGTPTEKLLQHQMDEPVPVEQLRPDVSPRLGQIIRRLMAKRPDHRYATPAGAVAAFDAFLADGIEPAVATALDPSASAAQSFSAIPTLSFGDASASTAEHPVPARVRRRRSRWGWRFFGAVVAALAIGAASSLTYRSLRDQPTLKSSPPTKSTLTPPKKAAQHPTRSAP
jgi:serine/threonine protein kinase